MPFPSLLQAAFRPATGEDACRNSLSRVDPEDDAVAHSRATGCTTATTALGMVDTVSPGSKSRHDMDMPGILVASEPPSVHDNCALAFEHSARRQHEPTPIQGCQAGAQFQLHLVSPACVQSTVVSPVYGRSGFPSLPRPVLSTRSRQPPADVAARLQVTPFNLHSLLSAVESHTITHHIEAHQDLLFLYTRASLFVTLYYGVVLHDWLQSYRHEEVACLFMPTTPCGICTAAGFYSSRPH